MNDESTMMRGECVGGLQEHHRVPAVQETFLCGKKKGGCICVSALEAKLPGLPLCPMAVNSMKAMAV